jgi:hypothetical protein
MLRAGVRRRPVVEHENIVVGMLSPDDIVAEPVSTKTCSRGSSTHTPKPRRRQGLMNL